MSFFTPKQIDMAKSLSAKQLRSGYKKSERDLKKCARRGNEKGLVKVMERHGNFEYAMLYQKTPNFKDEVKIDE